MVVTLLARATLVNTPVEEVAGASAAHVLTERRERINMSVDGYWLLGTARYQA
jgi:hypothetical protein